MICPYHLHCLALPRLSHALLLTAHLHSPAVHCGTSTASSRFALPIVPLCPLGPPYCPHTAPVIPGTALAILDGCVSHIVAQSPDYTRPEAPPLYFLSC